MTTESRCGWTHYASMARACGRFIVDGPINYQARSGGPLRANRAAAIDDECSRTHSRPDEPWVVETVHGELLDENPLTEAWWTAEEATRYVDSGLGAWAVSRVSVGLPVD